MADRSGAERALHGLAWGLAGALAVICGWVVVARFVYPIDGEWMTGAVREGVDRVRDGRPLYGPPTARFIPFVYPPLFFWLAALFARVTSTFVAAKLVSILATIAASFAIVRIARVFGATPRWQRLALVLQLATYPLTLLFYDLERVDALYAAMIVAGLAALLGDGSARDGSARDGSARDGGTRDEDARGSTRNMVLAGVLLGGSFFAKQAGLFAFTAVLLGLVVAGQRRRAVVVGLAGAAVLALGFGYLELTTQGWFRYYCLKLPRSHGIRPQRLSLFFITDAPKAFAFTIGSVAMIVPPARALLVRGLAAIGRARAEAGRHGETDGSEPTWRETVFAAALVAAMGGAFVFRAHAGGWENVLVAWLPLGAAATAAAASRAEAKLEGPMRARVGALIAAGLCVQLLGAMFDPSELAPERGDLEERQRLVAQVRRFEARGEVLMTITGDVTAEPSAHAAALYDVVRAGDRAPADLIRGLEERRYVAIFVGTADEYDCDEATCKELVSLLGRNYFLAARRPERPRSGMTGFDGRPRWIMRPRSAPLGEIALADLYRLQRVEMAIAETFTARAPEGAEVEPNDAVEQLAAAQLAEDDAAKR